MCNIISREIFEKNLRISIDWNHDGWLRLFIEARQGFGEPWPQSWEFVSERCRIWNQFAGKWNYVNK